MGCSIAVENNYAALLANELRKLTVGNAHEAKTPMVVKKIQHETLIEAIYPEHYWGLPPNIANIVLNRYCQSTYTHW